LAMRGGAVLDDCDGYSRGSLVANRVTEMLVVLLFHIVRVRMRWMEDLK